PAILGRQAGKVVLRVVRAENHLRPVPGGNVPVQQGTIEGQIDRGGRPGRRRGLGGGPNGTAGHCRPNFAIGEDHAVAPESSRMSSARTQSRFTPVSASWGSSTSTAPVCGSRWTNATGTAERESCGIKKSFSMCRK